MRISISLLGYISLVCAVPFEHLHHVHKRQAEADADPATVYVTNIVMVNQFEQTNPTTTSSVPQETLSLVLNDNMQKEVTSDAQTSNEVATLQLVPNQVPSTDDVGTTKITATESSIANTNTLIADTISSVPTTLSTSPTSSSDASTTSTSNSSSDFSSDSNSVSFYASKGKGITYSPYSNSGSCKSSSEIASDLSKLTSFDIIRVYAPDCNIISVLLDNLSSSQQIFAGLYYLNSLESDVELLASQVKSSSRGWDAIYAINVGNEWLNSNTYDITTVISAISKGRSLLSNQGYNGKVVTVDTVVAFQNNPSLCDSCDFVAVNQHSFWNGNISPEDSGDFLVDTITQMNSLCGKDTLICESGWPTQGNTYGSCVPGKDQQLEAIKSIAKSSAAAKTIFFTTYDDLWKSPGDHNVEQYWGIFD